MGNRAKTRLSALFLGSRQQRGRNQPHKLLEQLGAVSDVKLHRQASARVVLAVSYDSEVYGQTSSLQKALYWRNCQYDVPDIRHIAM